MRKKFFKSFLIFLLVILILLIWLVAIRSSREIAADAQRTVDLEQVRIYLEIYFEENDRYPGLAGNNQWSILDNVLIGLIDPNTFSTIKQIPQDPYWPDWTYEYWVASDNSDYILKANLQTHTQDLDDDGDGQILGADCGQNSPEEREYCLSNY